MQQKTLVALDTMTLTSITANNLCSNVSCDARIEHPSNRFCLMESMTQDRSNFELEIFISK